MKFLNCWKITSFNYFNIKSNCYLQFWPFFWTLPNLHFQNQGAPTSSLHYLFSLALTELEIDWLRLAKWICACLKLSLPVKGSRSKRMTARAAPSFQWTIEMPIGRLTTHHGKYLWAIKVREKKYHLIFLLCFSLIKPLCRVYCAIFTTTCLESYPSRACLAKTIFLSYGGNASA